jgi:hypothetical protein
LPLAKVPAQRDWSAGMDVFDISKRTEPRQIGFMHRDARSERWHPRAGVLAVQPASARWIASAARTARSV